MRQSIRVVGALSRRALNEILRVPGAAIPGILAPTIFLIGLSGAFGKAAQLPGFQASDFRMFIVPVSRVDSLEKPLPDCSLRSSSIVVYLTPFGWVGGITREQSPRQHAAGLRSACGVRQE